MAEKPISRTTNLEGIMKKLITMAVAAGLVLTIVPVASAGKKPRQTETGIVAAPAPYTDDSGCYAGLHRRAAIVTMNNANGPIGHNFEVDPKTWNKPFTLEVASTAAGDADLDIYFYLADLGTPQQVAEDPLNAGSPATISFNTREAGGEVGKVPATAKHVIVCQYGGAQGASAGAEFVYNAF